MIQFILDTDHLSLHQRQHLVLQQRLAVVSAEQIAVTTVSFGEQVQGWLTHIHQAQDDQLKVVRGHRWLQHTLEYFARMPVLPFDEVAALRFLQLKQQRLRVGTQDLRIAAIALANDCTVVTRNRRDFERIPELRIEDWLT